MGSVKLLRETTIDQPDDMILTVFQEIGQILAEARVEQNLTIKQVASKIHIRQRYLIDLEQGYLSDLPGRVYILGFIRTYARLLSLDGEELIRRVNNLPNMPDYERSQAPVPMNPEEEPSHLILIVSAALILMVSIGGYLFLRPSSKTTRPETNLTPIEQTQSQTQQIQEPSPQESVLRQDKAEEEEIEEQSITLPPESSKEASSELLPKIIYPKNMPSIGADPSSLKEEKPQIPSILNNKIILKASEPSWVEVRDNEGRVIFMRVMKSGEEYVVPEKPGVTISTGNAGGMNILVGGEQLPSLGARGEVKRGIHVETLR